MQSENINPGGPRIYELSHRYRTASLGLGICLLILALTSIIIGGCGFISFYGLNGSVYTGHDIWIGTFYFITGVLAIVAYKGGNRPHLMRSYYAFTIISFIFSLVQFGLALGFMFGGYYYPIWSNIVSSVLAIFGFSFTMACMILLSQGVFCTPSSTRLPTYTPYTYGSITNNQQIVAPHIPQSNNQPAMTANMNPGLGSQQPTIFQSLDGRQFYVAVPANAVIQPQVAASTNAIVQPQPPNYQVTNSSQNSKA